MKYEAMFEEWENEEELIASLGTPTKLAISLALNYVPSPPPASIAVDTVEPGENLGEFAAGGSEEAAEEAAEEGAEEGAEEAAGEESGEAAEEEMKPAPAPEAEESPAEAEEEVTSAPAGKRRVRPFGLIVAILFGLIIGVPIALALILVGVPFIVSGIALVAMDIWAAVSAIPYLSMVSDILVVAGVGLVIGGIGLFITWFGLWLSFELGYLWIGGVVLRLGRALTYKKEVAEQ